MDNSDIRILAVDDEPEILFATVRLLKKEGYEVLQAINGRQCLEMTDKEHPDLILLDVKLPDIEGTEVCRELKNNPEYPETFILMLSGSKTSSHDQATGLDAGADGYMARPVSNREFISRINSMVRLIRAERSLRIALAEKETLLKEVHHRVKNNLAVIMGLIDLQSQFLHEESAKIIFADLSVRIRSMALIHEQLYQSSNLARINFQKYCEALITHIRVAYEDSRMIQVIVAAEDVEMSLDYAVPCGLLITELVTNAYKYAFPERRHSQESASCTITISANWDNTNYSLAVTDNGVGLPANFDWTKSNTLGLQLVSMIGQHQLGGKISIDRTNGTTVRLQFAPKHPASEGNGRRETNNPQ